MSHINIAIDGPAGAGKSTIAKAVAAHLGILHLDTGAMYRAMALKALRRGIEPGDAAAVTPLLADTEIFAKNIDGVQHTYLDGEDVSFLIRTQEVGKGASDIGVIPAVRLKLAGLQQQIAKQSDVVMDGRDIGSYVMPDAPYKFYITASVSERAKRRLRELQAKGQYLDVSLGRMEAEISARDYTDSHREFAPLRQAQDAVFVDTTDMDIQTAIACVLGHIKEAGK